MMIIIHIKDFYSMCSYFSFFLFKKLYFKNINIFCPNCKYFLINRNIDYNSC